MMDSRMHAVAANNLGKVGGNRRDRVHVGNGSIFGEAVDHDKEYILTIGDGPSKKSMEGSALGAAGAIDRGRVVWGPPSFLAHQC